MKHVLVFNRDIEIDSLSIPYTAFDYVNHDKIIAKVNAFLKDYGFEALESCTELRECRHYPTNKRGYYCTIICDKEDNVTIHIIEEANCWIEESK